MTKAMEISILLVIGAVIGGGLNVVRGWNNSPAKLDPKLVAGGLITGVIGAIALVQALSIPADTGPTSLVLLGLITGFTADFGISKLKSDPKVV